MFIAILVYWLVSQLEIISFINLKKNTDCNYANVYNPHMFDGDNTYNVEPPSYKLLHKPHEL